jgi:hypothetical protein
MTKVPQSHDDLLAHLRDCVGYLQRSAISFNQGFLSEAKRMAAATRMLLHDTRESHSLLEQLGYKRQMRFINSAHPVVPHNLVTHQGLVAFGMNGNTPSFIALWNVASYAGHSRGYQSFNDWWNYVVIIDANRVEFTRRDLILTLANQDGGARVDPGLDVAYANLTRNNSLGWQIARGERGTEGFEPEKCTIVGPLAGVELLSVQQIAFELATSISEF